MPDHHVRDVRYSVPINYIADGNNAMGIQTLYHFLRVAGWERIWQCSGWHDGTHSFNPNHVPDGNVQQSGTSEFSSINGAGLAKDTSVVKSGDQSLRVSASDGGEGVQTASLYTMRPPLSGSANQLADNVSGPTNGEMTLEEDTGLGADYQMIRGRIVISGDSASGNNGSFRITRIPYEPTGNRYVSFYNPGGTGKSYDHLGNDMTYVIQYRYELMMWFRCGAAWTVEVDPGTGVWETLANLGSTGGSWELLERGFYVKGSGSVRFRITKDSAGSDTLYVGGMNVSWPYYEGSVWAEGTDGILTNPDQFSVGAGDSYVPGNFDVGHMLFVWDPQNETNSGAYPITANLGGGVLQVDVRSQTVDFTTVAGGGLRWRIVDIYEHSWINAPEAADTVGFGLESPHTSKQRFFLRANTGQGQITKTAGEYWGAPADTDFDFSTGHFYMTGPSSMRSHQGSWQRISGSSDANDMHVLRGPYTYTTTPTVTRTFVKLAGDHSYLAFAHGLTDMAQASGFVFGFASTPDTKFTEIETWGIHGSWNDRGNTSVFGVDNNRERYGYENTVMTPEGIAIAGKCVNFGVGASTDTWETNAGASPTPWSNNEPVKPPLVLHDSGKEHGKVAYRELGAGFWQGRINMPNLTLFDSDSKLSLGNGFCWSWNGGVLPS